jgi:PAS domain S-box-containing protein
VNIARLDQALSSIKLKVLLPLGLASIAVCLFSLWYLQQASLARVENQVLARAQHLADALDYAAEITGSSPALRRIVTALGAEKDVNLIIVTVGAPGEILAASKLIWIGRSVEKLPDSLRSDLERSLRSGAAVSRWSATAAEAVYVLPLVLHRRQGYGVSESGAILVRMDTRRLQYEISQESRQFILLMLGAVALMNLLAYGLLHWFVFRPLDAIHGAVDKRQSGDVLSFAPLLAHDEIGRLSETLNTLVRQLAEGEQRFRSFADGASVMLWMTDVRNHSMLFNKTWLRFTGRSLDEELAYTHSWRGYNIHPEDRPAVLKTYAAGFRSRTGFEHQYRLQRCDGDYRHIAEVGCPLFAEDESFQGFIGTCLDITEQKAVERDLARLALVANLTDNAVIITDAQGYIEWVNAGFVRLTGFTQEESVGRKPGALLQGPESNPEIVTFMSDKIKTGEGFNVELVNYTKSRKPYWVAIEVRPIKDSSGARTGFIAIEGDITERKQRDAQIRQLNEELEYRVKDRTARLTHTIGLLKREMAERKEQEAQLMQARKMEAVGQLTGGIAHDFNNLLTIIKGNLGLLRARTSPDSCEDISLLIDDALSAVEDGADLTSNLLSFSRKRPLHPSTTDVNALLRDFGRLIGRTLSNDIGLRIVTAEETVEIETDNSQLQNALLNLALNARDAMPNGGTLSLSSRVRKFAVGDHDLPADLAHGAYVEISVTDSGRGMTAAEIEHAFEPFFTTKPVGKGSGLGLSMVYGFATQSGGTAVISSEIGRGTSVSLLLPLDRDSTALVADQIDSLGKPRGQVTILVVEDEVRLRRLAVRYISDSGYGVLEAGDADEAMEILDTEADVDLVFSDIVMPGSMNGRDLAVWIEHNRPDVKVLLTTGYSKDGRSKPQDAGEAGPAIVPKPYTKQELNGSIRAALEPTREEVLNQ